MEFTPKSLRRFMRFWPPYLGAGIVVREVVDDWSHVVVDLHTHRLNANVHGTAFGGSLQSMTDPFYCLMLHHRLGPAYLCWDQAAEIRFVKPGERRVRARMEVTAEQEAQILAETADGAKSLTWFECDITDRSGEVVAKVRRQVYVRRKRER